MAKNRMINTKFWDDNYITTLDFKEKLIFLYLLTNPLTNISGVYEVSLNRIAFDTGIDSLSIQETLSKFSKSDKIYYIDGWIFIRNFSKHQKAKSRKIQIGIKHSLSEIPAKVKQKIDSLSIAFDISESESEPKSESKLKPKVEKTPAQEMKDFLSNPEKIVSLLKEKGGDENIVRREIAKFISYWTERNKSGTKERWELQPTFDVSRRLGNWFSKIQDFNKKPKIVKIRE